MYFEQLWNELLARLPQLDPGYAPTLVQRAWRDVRDSRPWSFLIGNGILFSPATISTGSVSVTQFSSTITFDADARAALTGLTNPVITLRQFRVSSGVIYSISEVDAGFAANGIATLDRPYLEATDTAAGYQVYRCYYGPPLVNGTEVTDFLRYRTVYNPSTLQRFRLYGTVEELNIMDPKRVTAGNPWGLFTHSLETGKFYEMYPQPIAEQSYIAAYQKRGTDLATGESLPASIPDEVVMEAAMYHACLWAESAKGRISVLKGVAWPVLAATHKAIYEEMLHRAKIQDENTLRQNWSGDDWAYAGYGQWPFAYSPNMPNGGIAIW